ncbi:hypothetical protein [Streptomyces sp. NPDC050560]|uniref:hypothetical protein n=1 Tax=Streptomyces sp. NPDC050560 TaxID=3365630 RepID=UPI0037A2D1B4
MNPLAAPASSTRHRPPPVAVLAGFLVLLAAVFAVAFTAGASAGPVSPTLHPAPVEAPPAMGGMEGMGGMGGMR